MKDIANGFASQTSVGIGALAGAACTMGWWILSLIMALEVPDAIVAASVVLVTAALQYIIPHRNNKMARREDHPNA